MGIFDLVDELTSKDAFSPDSWEDQVGANFEVADIQFKDTPEGKAAELLNNKLDKLQADQKAQLKYYYEQENANAVKANKQAWVIGVVSAAIGSTVAAVVVLLFEHFVFK